jgi:hypothetical protein
MFPRPTRARLASVALALALALIVPVASAVAAAARGPSLTVYTSDLGLVREPRVLDLSGSRDTVRLTDVPERLDFASVRLVPAGEARVTRLAYRYDVENGDRMLEAARGSRVRVLGRGDRVTEGTLLSADGSWLVVRADDGGISTLARATTEEVRLARPPALLSQKPTLEAVIEGGRRGKADAELSYLTAGLSWNAEHVVVRRGEDAVVWSASVTVQNACGRDFVDADLKLVAGEPRREMGAMPAPKAVMMEMARAAAPDLSEQAFSEYHLYTLGRTATLRDRETQSLTMIAPHAVKVTPRYLYRGGDSRGVALQLELQNTAAAGLGVPLPGGRVRIYEPDPAGELQFVGETRIAHTPEGEKVTLEMGSAFDLAAERRQMDDKRISDRERQYTIEIKLRNRKKSAVTIRVEEPVGGDFEVLGKTHEFVKKDANTLRFDVPVGAGKEVVLSYTVRVRY